MKRIMVKDYNQIFEQPITELEKVRDGFDWVTSMYLTDRSLSRSR